jgi:WD40 repeat protein
MTMKHSSFLRDFFLKKIYGDIVSGSADSTIRIRNDGTSESTLTDHTDTVRALTTLSNYDIVSASDDLTIKIWSKI